jgi:hypothetical protein
MNTRKVITGGIIGGIVYFLLGWLIYGIILSKYMAANGNPCIMRPMEQMIWWALIISTFCSGFLLAVIFNWANVAGWMEGAKKAALFGLIFSLAIDLGQYSMSTMFLTTAVLLVDVIAGTVMTAVVGAVIAWVMGKTGK